MNYLNKNNLQTTKFNDYMIIDSIHRSPPYQWSNGIFQTFKPVSGNFPIGNNFSGNELCVNNQTGRGFYANPCGYWNKTPEQFNSGKHNTNIQLNGSMFPTQTITSNVMSPPNDRVVFGYARIGQEFRNK